MNNVISLEEYRRNKEATAEEEYKEFVEILRLFVKIKMPSTYEVHVFVENNIYILKDAHSDNLLWRNEGDQEDALLSALVNIAPLKLVIHDESKFYNKDIIKQLKDVFEKRVEFA